MCCCYPTPYHKETGGVLPKARQFHHWFPWVSFTKLPYIRVGVTKPIFQNYQNTDYIWNVAFIFDGYHHSLAAVTSVKYGCDFKILACNMKQIVK